MLDAEFIKECADPSLKPAVVQQFIQAVGSTDPLAITVTSGGRLVLIPKPNTPERAMEIIRDNVRGSIVRVGLTQFPAGIDVRDASELVSDIVEPCTNLRMGTAMFSKILRLVARWYGNPTNEEVFPQLLDDALHAWQTGEFEGKSVFRAPRPEVATPQAVPSLLESETRHVADSGEDEANANKADMRIDLTRIGGM